jgi:NTP pyrophosphatase (non-canonical NTP hydrolase)
MNKMVKNKKRLCVNDIPNETLLRCAIRDNKMLLEKIRNLEAEKADLQREINNCKKQLAQKTQEFANWKKNSKLFYAGIEKDEGVAELLEISRDYKKEELRSLRKQRDDLLFKVGQYAQLLQKHNLL